MHSAIACFRLRKSKLKSTVLLLLFSFAPSIFAQAVMNGSSIGTTGLTNLNIIANNTTQVTITTAGNVGIGTTTPGYALQVTGSSGVGAVAYYYTSDIRLKKEVEPIQGLDNILKLQGVKFRWRSNDAPEVGLIAQDVEKVIPQLVRTSPVDGVKSVKYGNLVAPIIESIKEFFARWSTDSEEIHRQLATLKDQNAELKSAFCEIHPEHELCREE